MPINKKQLELNQTKNDQAGKELDDELNDILEDEGEAIEPTKKETKKVPESEEIEDEETTPKEEEEEEESPGDEEEEEPTEEEEEEPKPEEEEEKTPKEEKKEEKKAVERPNKFIPLEKYIPEKKQWQKDKDDLEIANKKIADLEKINESDKTNEEKEEAIKKMAEEYDTPPKFLKDILKLVEGGEKVSPKEVVEEEREKKEEEEVPAPEAEKTEDEIVEEFDTEFEDFTPQIKKLYPKATEGQIKEAKKSMDEFAHSEGLSKYPLDHILKIQKESFDKILSSTPNNPGIEGGKQGAGGFKEVSAKSFKKDADGTYDFGGLHKMEDGPKKEALVNGLPLEAWDAYVTDLDSNQELKVTKNDGRVVSLK